MQVEDGDERLPGEEVVVLVREEVAQAAGGEGAQQLREVGIALLEVAVEGGEAGARARLGVVAREGVVEGGAALGPEPLAHHHLNEAAQTADALQQLLVVAAVDDEGVQPLTGHAG